MEQQTVTIDGYQVHITQRCGIFGTDYSYEVLGTRVWGCGQRTVEEAKSDARRAIRSLLKDRKK
jgi:hypothetical protein